LGCLTFMKDNMKTQNQTQIFYDFLAPRYDDYMGALSAMGALLLEEQVEQQKRTDSFWKDLPPKARILDCACGRGILVLAWKQLGLDIQGSDLSEGMLSVARSNAQKLGIDAKFTQTAWEDLPQYFKEEFDFVLCLDNSLISVTDDDALVRSVIGMRKVLKPGGICRIGLSAPIRLKEPGIPGGKFYLSVKENRKEVAFEIWESREDVRIQDLLWLTQEDGQWTLDTVRETLKMLTGDDLKKIMQEAGFPEVEFKEIRYPEGHVRAWVGIGRIPIAQD